MGRVGAYMLWVGVLAAPALAGERPSRPGPTGIDWSAFLIHDAAVQAELQLTASQRRKVTELMDEVAGQLWKLRLLPPEQAGPQSRPLAKKVQTTLRRILSDPQQARLKQIALQSRWPHALLEPAVVSRLDITADQRRRLTEIIERTQRDLDELRQQGPPSAALAAARRDIEVRRDEEIAGVLTAEQQKRWPSLAGKPFDLSRIGFMRAPAPELIEGEWINSAPLRLAELRGRVVVVHFWTFGCSNCIANYPAYRAWQKAYAGKDLTIIGIHTPETAGERVVEAVREKAKQNELAFPILVDNERRNWDAWANNIWPAVYLIDKHGRIRYWWYGELNWQGAEGEKYMTGRINELLAEPL